MIQLSSTARTRGPGLDGGRFHLLGGEGIEEVEVPLLVKLIYDPLPVGSGKQRGSKGKW